MLVFKGPLTHLWTISECTVEFTIGEIVSAWQHVTARLIETRDEAININYEVVIVGNSAQRNNLQHISIILNHYEYAWCWDSGEN